MTKASKRTKALTESSILVALATVLSLLKLVDMPYGGSVTLASMVPILIASYRHGVGFGLLSGFTFSAIQQLLGLNNLSYVTGWQSVLAVILLDYILAFTAVGLGGSTRRVIGGRIESVAKRQSLRLGVGMAAVCILRYILHTVAGATVWAGLSIPTEAALLYSIGYNATYMIPETVVNTLVAVYLGSAVDFEKSTVTRIGGPIRERADTKARLSSALPRIGYLLAALTVIGETALISPLLQDPESGEFTLSRLGETNLTAVIIILSVGITLTAACFISGRILKAKCEDK